jgi:hypothetical protein
VPGPTGAALLFSWLGWGRPGASRAALFLSDETERLGTWCPSKSNFWRQGVVGKAQDRFLLSAERCSMVWLQPRGERPKSCSGSSAGTQPEPSSAYARRASLTRRNPPGLPSPRGLKRHSYHQIIATGCKTGAAAKRQFSCKPMYRCLKFRPNQRQRRNRSCTAAGAPRAATERSRRAAPCRKPA